MGGVEATSDPFLGRVLDGRYAIESRLGEGGLGVVYRAKQTRLGRAVAVKVLHAEHAQKAALRARFEREARSLGTLVHPNIVQVIDYGIEDGSPFLVMELLEGRPLNDAIRAGIEPDRAWEIARTIVGAVAYAHARRVVHRDLKPANVFLQRDPEGNEITRVLDFGLAKFVDDESEETVLTKAGSILGTPAYMSPEQASGAPTDERSDVYSLGIVLFEILTGQRPFQGPPVELLRMHLVAELPPLSSARPGIANSEAIDAILRRATAKAIRDRYADAGELLAALEALPQEPRSVVSGLSEPRRDVSFDETMLGERAKAAPLGFGAATQPVRSGVAAPGGFGHASAHGGSHVSGAFGPGGFGEPAAPGGGHASGAFGPGGFGEPAAPGGGHASGAFGPGGFGEPSAPGGGHASGSFGPGGFGQTLTPGGGRPQAPGERRRAQAVIAAAAVALVIAGGAAVFSGGDEPSEGTEAADAAEAEAAAPGAAPPPFERCEGDPPSAVVLERLEPGAPVPSARELRSSFSGIPPEAIVVHRLSSGPGEAARRAVTFEVSRSSWPEWARLAEGSSEDVCRKIAAALSENAAEPLSDLVFYADRERDVRDEPLGSLDRFDPDEVEAAIVDWLEPLRANARCSYDPGFGGDGTLAVTCDVRNPRRTAARFDLVPVVYQGGTGQRVYREGLELDPGERIERRYEVRGGSFDSCACEVMPAR